MQSIIESGKLYLDPDVELQRFLVPFTVGTNKIKLYGLPVLMIAKSELIKSLIDKLSLTENNPLAISQSVDSPNGLIIVWLYMNNNLSSLPVDIDPRDYLNIWQWLNYFDVPYNSEFIKQYIRYLFLSIYFKQLIAPESKNILADILAKTKIIDPKTYSDLSERIKYEIENKSNLVDLVLESSTGWIDKFRVDRSKLLDDQLGKFGIVVKSGSFGGSKYIQYKGVSYTYPALRADPFGIHFDSKQIL